MMQEIWWVLARSMDYNTWMDKETKEGAKRKLLNMVATVGYADFILNDSELDAVYEDVRATPRSE